MATVKIPSFGLNIGTGKFTVDATTGATVIASTLSVTTNVSITGSSGARSVSVHTGGFASFYDSADAEMARVAIVGAGAAARLQFTPIAPSLGATFTSTLIVGGLLTTVASATGSAGLNIPHGAAPTSPVNGDLWTTTAGAFIRINGVTKTFTLT